MTKKRRADDGHLIFVSYAHENDNWIRALGLDHLPAGIESARFWLDEDRLQPGRQWTSEAQEALEHATAAVLLISRDFLKSAAIREHELPLILERYRAGEICVIFVPIGPVTISEIETHLQFCVRNIISIPPWDSPLPAKAEPRPDLRDKIVSAVTEPIEVQNLRRRLASHYELEEKLGDGTFSTVFKAHDHQLERKVVVKLLREERRSEHFKTIRRVGSATAHSNILSVYGACLDADPPHYFLEYVDGQSLHAILDAHWKGKPAPIDYVQNLLKAGASAITHAHRMDIDDLNIKPCNIIVVDHKSPREVNYFLNLNSYHETDFLDDEAWRSDRDDVLYLPPEYRMPDISSDGVRKADQYRLGVVAYEMLVGSSRFKVLAKDLRERDVPQSWHWPALATEREECPNHLCDVVDRMVKTDPRNRYHSIDDVVAIVRGTDLDVETVRDSYRRLMTSTDTQTEFFRSFYTRFLGEYQGASGFFDPRRFGALHDGSKCSQAWQRQFQVLKEAVLLLIVFKSFGEEGRELNILTRIAEEHARRRIPAGLYPCFGEALIDVVVEMDRRAPLKPEALRRAWASVIQPGIDYMRRKTEEIETRRYQGDSAHDAYPGATSSRTVGGQKARRSAKLSKLEDAPSGRRKSDRCEARL